MEKYNYLFNENEDWELVETRKNSNYTKSYVIKCKHCGTVQEVFEGSVRYWIEIKGKIYQCKCQRKLYNPLHPRKPKRKHKLKCQMCGKEFVGFNYQKYCCDECRRMYWKQKRKVKVRKKRITRPRFLDKYTCSVLELANKGYTDKKIANELGLSEIQIRHIISSYLKGKMPDRSKNSNQNKNPISKVKKELYKYNLEYISGYSGCESQIKYKDLNCGHINEHGYHNLMNVLKGNKGNRKYSCQKCVETKRLLKEQEERVVKQHNESINKCYQWLKNNTIKSNVIYKNTCLNCGGEFETTRENQKYCCKKCSTRFNDRTRANRKNKLIVSRRHDNDITLDKLIKKYKHKCYLCGMDVDLSDYYVKENGTIITGDYYPSIEHVIPISKGGTNTWDNVQLAHRKCNSLKRDLLVNKYGEIRLF